MERADRNRYLLRTYGITVEEFDALVEHADGRCPICLKPFKGTPVVDHDHRDGHVRGVLCTHCNYRVIGRHRDPEVFARASVYLEQPPAVEVLGEARIVPAKCKNGVRKNASRGMVTRSTKEAP